MYMQYYHMYRYGFRYGRFNLSQSPVGDMPASLPADASECQWMVPGTVDPLED